MEQEIHGVLHKVGRFNFVYRLEEKLTPDDKDSWVRSSKTIEEFIGRQEGKFYKEVR